MTKKRGESHDIRDIMALIGFSGPVCGIVALMFPVGTALAMVSKLLGEDERVVDETVLDAVGEMVNIIAGGAKTKPYKGDGPPIDLGLPTVIRGQSYMLKFLFTSMIACPSHTVWLEIPFSSDLGPFHLYVNFESDLK